MTSFSPISCNPNEVPRDPSKLFTYLDGDQHCVVRGGFVNLAVSPAGFGSTIDIAVLDFFLSEDAIQMKGTNDGTP